MHLCIHISADAFAHVHMFKWVRTYISSILWIWRIPVTGYPRYIRSSFNVTTFSFRLFIHSPAYNEPKRPHLYVALVISAVAAASPEGLQWSMLNRQCPCHSLEHCCCNRHLGKWGKKRKEIVLMSWNKIWNKNKKFMKLKKDFYKK